ncbi:MAG: WecB/TagA/CpsF family glycosyltransferase [Sandaracinaceae bacterium]|nr:WecB/TagA/CpsF family glycosyltransferase [Sandaracinaceae bacterium]
METTTLLGVEVDCVTMAQAVDRLWDVLRAPDYGCAYVVTPNLDHARLLEERTDLRAAYADAALRVVDGMPLVWASWLFRKPVRERVAGSDLVPELLASASPARRDRPLSFYLLGAAPGVAERAAEPLLALSPHLAFAGCYSPPFGFEHDDGENERIATRIAEAAPDVLVLGLGAPKQELWVHRHRHQLHTKLALCVGATIDFFAGEVRRAPPLVRAVGLEWAHRMVADPKRLIPRYGRDALALPRLLYADLRARR